MNNGDGDKWLFAQAKSHLSPSPLVHPVPVGSPVGLLLLPQLNDKINK